VNLKYNINDAYSKMLVESNEHNTMTNMGFTIPTYEVLKNTLKGKSAKRIEWYASKLKDELLPAQDIDLNDTTAIAGYIGSYKFKNQVVNIENWLAEMCGGKSPERFNDFSMASAVQEATRWRKNLGTNDFSHDNGYEAEMIHQYSNGYYWVNMNTADSEGEHCSDTECDTILSLRDDDKRVLVSVALTSSHDVVSQIRGEGNSRPHSKYDEFIVDLLVRVGVKSYQPEGYLSKDFSPLAMDDDELKVKLRKGAPDFYASLDGLLAEDDSVHWDYVRRDLGYENASDDDNYRVKDANESYWHADQAIFNDMPIPEEHDLQLDEDYFASLDANDELPDQIQSYIKQDPRHALSYVKHVIKKRTPSLESAIAMDSKTSFEYATEVLLGEDVPESIINSISSVPEHALGYADYKEWNDLDDELFYSIVQTPEGVAKYAEVIADNDSEIDPTILKGLAKHPDVCMDLAVSKFNNQHNIDDKLLLGLASNPENAFKFINDQLKYQNVPKSLLKGLSVDPKLSYRYAKRTRKEETPQEIINGIALHPEYSLMYAQGREDVPEVITKSIASSAPHMKRYLTDTDGTNVPQSMLDNLSSDPEGSLDVAMNVFNGENVPACIFAGFDGHKDKCVEYGIFKRGKDLTSSMISSIIAKPEDALKVAMSADSMKDVDNRIIDTISESPSCMRKFNDHLSSTNQQLSGVGKTR
jgi:hypothetical protein